MTNVYLCYDESQFVGIEANADFLPNWEMLAAVDFLPNWLALTTRMPLTSIWWEWVPKRQNGGGGAVLVYIANPRLGCMLNVWCSLGSSWVVFSQLVSHSGREGDKDKIRGLVSKFNIADSDRSFWNLPMGHLGSAAWRQLFTFHLSQQSLWIATAVMLITICHYWWLTRVTCSTLLL